MASQALYSIDAEQAVLGAFLLDNRVYTQLGRFLRAEHFYDPLHKAIYAAGAALVQDNKPANPITVLPAAGQSEVRPGLTVKAYLTRLVSGRTFSPDVEAIGELVRDYAVARQVAAIGAGVGAANDNPAVALTKAFDELDTARADLLGALDQREQIGVLGDRLLARADRIRTGVEAAPAFSTGLPDLDRALQGGLYPGELTVLAGRPGMGKTALACTLARLSAKAAAGRAGTMLIELEVDGAQISARMLADMAYRPRDAISFGAILQATHLTDEDMWRLEEVNTLLARLPITVDTSPSLSVSQILQRAKAEKERLAKRGMRLGPVIVDYLKFVKATERYAGQKVYEVGEITAGLRQGAKDLQIPFVLLHQLNRGVEAQGRADRRPDLSDLKDSGEVEADADVVMFCFREHYYLIKTPDYRANNPDVLAQALEVENDLELIIAKNRKGPLTTVKLYTDMLASHISQRAKGLQL